MFLHAETSFPASGVGAAAIASLRASRAAAEPERKRKSVYGIERERAVTTCRQTGVLASSEMAATSVVKERRAHALLLAGRGFAQGL